MRSPLDFRAIVAQANTLGERIQAHQSGRRNNPTFADCGVIANRISRWKANSAKGDSSVFAAHLQFLGLCMEDLPGILGPLRTDDQAPLPEWAAVLQEIAEFHAGEQTAEIKTGKRPAFLRLDDPLPFQDLYIPIVLYAKRRLVQCVSKTTHNQLSEAAHAEMERHLLRRLAALGAKAVYQQFQQFKAIAPFGFGPAPNHTPASDADDLYRAFVGHPTAARLFSLWEVYPVFARLCAELTADWVAGGAEFLDRLRRDRSGLRRRFAKGRDLGQVTALRCGLSDSHHHGRGVFALRFAAEVALIYKPRSLAPEKIFADLLRQQKAGWRWVPCAVEVWNRRTHGWMEWRTPKPCQNHLEARRCFWRLGALLGLSHLLRAVDCHSQNIIISGDHPTLVDLETLWHPQDIGSQHGSDLEMAKTAKDWPLLRTGMLSTTSEDSADVYLWGVLANRLPDRHMKVPHWIEVNQDAMRLAWEDDMPRIRQHLPHLGERPLLAQEFAGEIRAGCRSVGRKLLADPKRRKSLQRQIIRLARCSRRRLHRPTSNYFLLLERSLHPRCLKNGVERSVEWEVLRRDSKLSSEDIQAEIASLERLDIPRFAQHFNCSPTHELPTFGEFMHQTDFLKERFAFPRRHYAYQGEMVQMIE